MNTLMLETFINDGVVPDGPADREEFVEARHQGWITYNGRYIITNKGSFFVIREIVERWWTTLGIEGRPYSSSVRHVGGGKFVGHVIHEGAYTAQAFTVNGKGEILPC